MKISLQNNEKWVKGFEGMYSVTTEGEVISYKRGRRKVLKAGVQSCGYLQVVLFKDSKPLNKYVHRLVAEAFLENKDNLPEVNHKDCCKSNNNASNLEWCSSSDNINHALENNLSHQMVSD